DDFDGLPGDGDEVAGEVHALGGGAECDGLDVRAGDVEGRSPAPALDARVGVGGEDAGRVRVVLADNQLAVENLRLDGGDPDPRAPGFHSGGGRLETDSAGREPDIRMVVLVGPVLMHESEMPRDRGAGEF